MRWVSVAHLEKVGYSAASHAEMMDKLVGYQRIREIMSRAVIKEGYGV